MENVHEHKSYGQQWRDDLSPQGLKASIAPVIPTGQDLKAQAKICLNVCCKAPYYVGKFCFRKQDN